VAVAVVEIALRGFQLALWRLRLPFDRLEHLEQLAEPFPQLRLASEALEVPRRLDRTPVVEPAGSLNRSSTAPRRVRAVSSAASAASRSFRSSAPARTSPRAFKAPSKMPRPPTAALYAATRT
jgi:hypothetical protein